MSTTKTLQQCKECQWYCLEGMCLSWNSNYQEDKCSYVKKDKLMTNSVKETNEVFARFHGWKHKPTLKGKGKGLWYFPEWGKAAFNGDNFQYHTSWDWLMPAWIKFRNLDLKNEEYQEFKSSLKYYLFTANEPNTFHERLYHAITWYNTTIEPTLKEKAV